MNDIYFLLRRITRARELTYHDRTIQQLKNSGGLRLIRNTVISDSIILYDSKVRDMLSQQAGEDAIREKIRDRLGNVLNIFVVYDMQHSNADSIVITKPTSNPSFITDRMEILNDLLNQVLYLQGHYIVTRGMEKDLIDSGEKLIALIKQKYQIK